jgi:hypothetical protein
VGLLFLLRRRKKERRGERREKKDGEGAKKNPCALFPAFVVSLLIIQYNNKQDLIVKY